ncbi:transposase [Fischerella thermalis CCMEE 5205]|nr:transposase [Fischerella thermalis CCMEE 5319]PMB49573.1 transposase [Fischerella thermalis CCMEE 5205]
MKPKFQDKFRVESIRLPNRDYAANGLYFVTICTRDRTCFFGDVIDGKVDLSEIGKIAQLYWAEIPSHFDHTYIDAYAIMPNHVHGIVVIDRPHNVETRHGQTRHGASLHQPQTQPIDQSNKFAPLKSGSLQAIINAYKSSVTRWCRKNGQENFGWQSRFYDHVIRADSSLDRIREYILNNPSKWEDDKDNPANLWM